MLAETLLPRNRSIIMSVFSEFTHRLTSLIRSMAPVLYPTINPLLSLIA